MGSTRDFPVFNLNHPKNFIGYLFVRQTIDQTTSIAAAYDRYQIGGDLVDAQRGAERFGWINRHTDSITPPGEQLLATTREQFGSITGGLTAIEDLYGSSTRLVDAHPCWKPALQQGVANSPRLIRLLRALADSTATSSRSTLSLPEFFLALYQRAPEFALTAFIRDNHRDNLSSLLNSDSDQQTILEELQDPSFYYVPTVQQLKSVLYHSGILTTRGSDARSLKPGKPAFEWALTNDYQLPGPETTGLKATTAHGSPLEASPHPDEQSPDYYPPDRADYTTSRVIRNTTIVSELKDTYTSTCQVCGEQRKRTPTQPYAEGHHLKPLGNPHNGPDAKSNLLIVCPQCHADLDYGLIAIHPDTLHVAHEYDQTRDSISLTISEAHDLNPRFLTYHNQTIVNWDWR
ncbi:HNH endonuclease [Haloarchaeobius baliensis]|uniref:HNH endonuclease n=1 Tax=Haloarchaeobius baliensis TaxID=1670458 RepID=UPI003F8815BC